MLEQVLYIAEADDCVKVGVSQSVRVRQWKLRNTYGRRFDVIAEWQWKLRNTYGRRFDVIAEWQHPNARAVEVMVCEALWPTRVAGVEAFAVRPEQMAIEIECAISRYYRLGITDQVMLSRASATNWRINDTLRLTRGDAEVEAPLYLLIERAIHKGLTVKEVAKAHRISESCLRLWYSRADLDEIRAKGPRDRMPTRKTQ